MSLLKRDLAFSFPDMRRLQTMGIAAMEVAQETARNEEKCMEELRRCVEEAPAGVDTSGMRRVLDQYQGTMDLPIYQETKELLRTRIDRLIDRISEIDRIRTEEVLGFGEQVARLKWQYSSVIGMIGKGTLSMGTEQFRERVEQVMALGESADLRRYFEVRDGVFGYQWSEIEKTARKSRLSEQEFEALMEVLRQIRTESPEDQVRNCQQFVLILVKAEKDDWLVAFRQQWKEETTWLERLSSSYYLLSMGIANADQTRLKEDLSKVQQSEWSDQQKADYITDLLREYSDEYELPYLSVMNRPEIRELLEQNEGVAQQVLAELGRLQIEQDIAQRMEASSGLSLAEHQAKWMVIDGKCYTYVMPYYGEIPGYTYMEVRRGPDPAAPDGYLYTVDYIPSSEASRYEFNNGLIVTYEVFSTFYNLVYFSLYLPYLQEQYGQGQVAKTTPKPGDPDFMEPAEGPGDTFRKNADPFKDVLGSGKDSHPEQWNEIIEEMKANGVEIVYRDGGMAYSPTSGKPGQLLIDESSSFGALLHEYTHYLDDLAKNYPGMSYHFQTINRVQMELHAYMQEIKLADSLGLKDIARQLFENYMDERSLLTDYLRH